MTPPAADPDDWTGRVVLVAGGSSGINLGIGRRFAAAGAQLVLLSRSPERIAAAAADVGGGALGLAADVRDYVQLDAAFANAHARFGDFDVVVSGAAGNFVAAAADMSANAFRTVVDIDLNGTFNVFRASYPRLRRPGASLIAITAGQAMEPMMHQAHACAAKAGVNMLVRCLAMEWGSEQIRVNAISPGPIAGTEGMRRLTPTTGDEQALRSRIPLQRYGEMDDVADLALFLSSVRAGFITGAVVNCDGGPLVNAFSRPTKDSC